MIMTNCLTTWQGICLSVRAGIVITAGFIAIQSGLISVIGYLFVAFGSWFLDLFL